MKLSLDNANQADAERASAQIMTLHSNIPLSPNFDTHGDLCKNWKRWLQIWDYYAIVSDLDGKEEKHKVATFITCIGLEGLEIFNGLPLSEEEKGKLDPIMTQMQEYCVGKTKYMNVMFSITEYRSLRSQ